MKTITEGFSYRVNFAASYIAQGRRTTRSFDNCFEMYDGDAVAVALYRRSRHNPKLRANLWKYISRDTVVPKAFEHRRVATRKLCELSASLIAQAEAKSAAFFAALEAERAA